jgi:hypothetical protein
VAEADTENEIEVGTETVTVRLDLERDIDRDGVFVPWLLDSEMVIGSDTLASGVCVGSIVADRVCQCEKLNDCEAESVAKAVTVYRKYDDVSETVSDNGTVFVTGTDFVRLFDLDCVCSLEADAVTVRRVRDDVRDIVKFPSDMDCENSSLYEAVRVPRERDRVRLGVGGMVFVRVGGNVRDRVMVVVRVRETVMVCVSVIDVITPMRWLS